MIITRPINSSEPDLLKGCTLRSLNIKDLSGKLICTIEAPTDEWTHDLLEAIEYDVIAPYGWDAYLQDDWIGSSEV